MKHTTCCVLLFSLLANAVSLAASVPSSIHYQGRLTDAQGDPVNATVQMSVRLYDAPSGGALLYEETIGSVAVANGVYSFSFGAAGTGASAGREIFASLTGAEHWLTLVVDAVEADTRVRLLAVPYAMKARESEDAQALAVELDNLPQTISAEVESSVDSSLAGIKSRLSFLESKAIFIELLGDLAFGEVDVGQSVTRTLIIRNSGTGSLTVTGISYPNCFSGNWSGIVAAGADQEVAVILSPSAAQTYSGTVTVYSNAISGASTLAISGTGITRVISIGGQQDFGFVPVGESIDRVVTIFNSGTRALAVSSITYPSGFSCNGAAVNIPANGRQDVFVTFSPTAEQSYNGLITVASNATSGTNTLSVRGVGMMVIELLTVQGGTLPPLEMGELNVATFQIGKHEVTWGEWQEVRLWAAANGYDIGSVGAGCADEHPVHAVSWYDVVKWCNAKSEKEGLTPVYTLGGTTYMTGQIIPDWNAAANGYRLPTEAEWEFAARGGNQTHGYAYSGSNDLNAVGWNWDNSDSAACNLYEGRGTRPVRQKASNEQGVYDMSGNVWEWCWDASGAHRRVRGGSWGDDTSLCTVSYRGYGTPDSSYNNGGFRLVRGVVVPESMVQVAGGTLSTINELDGTVVSTFRIGKYEVTWVEWQEVRAWAVANGYDIGGVGSACAGDHPVHTVNWYDVLKWCNARSEKEGLTPVYTVGGAIYMNGQTIPDWNTAANGYRLPTEAEWEFAARGGNLTHGYAYSGSNDLDAVGWHYYNSSGGVCDLLPGCGPRPVGRKMANELGLYDMSGNVLEWCWDLYHWNAVPFIRGGSWLDSFNYRMNVEWRSNKSAETRFYTNGLRLACNSGQ